MTRTGMILPSMPDAAATAFPDLETPDGRRWLAFVLYGAAVGVQTWNLVVRERAKMTGLVRWSCADRDWPMVGTAGWCAVAQPLPVPPVLGPTPLPMRGAAGAILFDALTTLWDGRQPSWPDEPMCAGILDATASGLVTSAARRCYMDAMQAARRASIDGAPFGRWLPDGYPPGMERPPVPGPTDPAPRARELH